jgi:hypothetical protein
MCAKIKKAFLIETNFFINQQKRFFRTLQRLLNANNKTSRRRTMSILNCNMCKRKIRDTGVFFRKKRKELKCYDLAIGNDRSNK